MPDPALPVTGWGFNSSAKELIGYIESSDPSLSSMQSDPAYYLDECYVANERRLRLRQMLPLRIASALLVLEVVAWIVDLASAG